MRKVQYLNIKMRHIMSQDDEIMKTLWLSHKTAIAQKDIFLRQIKKLPIK